MSTMNSIAGRKFGRLTALEPAIKERTSKGNVTWVCKCDCGELLFVSEGNLISGYIKSCGCLRSDTPIHHSWYGMLQRCYNPKNISYKYYGGRGIKVCDRWRYSFENFYLDMGERPKDRSLDRINNNGNYEPKNCKWSTRKEQMNNTRRQRLFIAYGPNSEVMTADSQIKFAREHNLSIECVSNCLRNLRRSIKGWRFEWLKNPNEKKSY